MPEDELEPLITECPSCQTRFRVSDTQLQRARGRVRCGACLAVFHGIDHLVLESLDADGNEEQAQQALDALLDELAGGSGADEPADPGTPGMAKPRSDRRPRKRPPIFSGFEEPGDDTMPSGAESGGVPALQVADEQAADKVTDVPFLPGGPDDSSGGADPDGAAADEPASGTAAGDGKTSAVPPAGTGPRPQPARRTAKSAVSAPNRSGSTPARRRTDAVLDELSPETVVPVVFGEPRRIRPMVWIGIVAGVLLLAVQVLWYQFDDWATEPGWRSVYAPICGVVGCELPVLRDLTQLSTRNLVVRTHPGDEDALRVNAVIVNRADFEQPFPVLELQFTTVRGNLVASRRFEPDEYLAGDAAGMTLIPPRTPVQIELDMHDPGPAAVNYRLHFR